MRIFARLAGHGHRAGEDGVEARRQRDIGRLDPALARAGHAADDDGKVGGRAGLGEVALQDGGKTLARRR